MLKAWISRTWVVGSNPGRLHSFAMSPKGNYQGQPLSISGGTEIFHFRRDRNLPFQAGQKSSIFGSTEIFHFWQHRNLPFLAAQPSSILGSTDSWDTADRNGQWLCCVSCQDGLPAVRTALVSDGQQNAAA